MNNTILPEIILKRSDDSNKDKKNFKFLDENTQVGNRNKLGGLPPSNLSEQRIPNCPSCHKRMDFYGQLDSINDEYMLGDCFLVLVFACRDCNEIKGFVHPTLVK